MTTRSSDSLPLQEFAASLGARDPKTIASYLTTVRDFVAWLATHPGASGLTRSGKGTGIGERRSIASRLPVSYSPVEDQPGDLAARVGAE
ncbi:MAG: hypothetical protein NVSMB27_46190 [Ktedonobacteraceae bacterium]